MIEDISVRFLEVSDLPLCMVLDASYHTDFVWQMEIIQKEGRFDVSFREIRLPRSMRVEYPRISEEIIDSFRKRDVVMAGHLNGEFAGFISILIHTGASLAQITDVVVNRRYRRRGVGSMLIRSAQNWARQNKLEKLQLEMQSKNFPAIELANKLGFEFCGYNDRYYKNQDIALFFTKRF